MEPVKKEEESHGEDIEMPDHHLDCYPYTFSPLLLFVQGGYFDKGHSNFNSVAEFFSSCVEVDMCHNVLYDQKNMRYEELLHYIADHRMIVTCCIDNHFTGFKVLGKWSLLYYDPMSPHLTLVSGEESFKFFASFLLLKCKYGDSQHIQEHKDYYTGSDSNSTRRTIYSLWKKINQLKGISSLHGVKSKHVYLDLDAYYLINSPSDSRLMSTQQTENTCYFQTYLFALLCQVCNPVVDPHDSSSVLLQSVDLLKRTSIALATFLLEFFVQGDAMRPLTNSNFVIDFYRYQHATYYDIMTRYLSGCKVRVPDYAEQYQKVMHYYRTTKTLHRYGKFQMSDKMPSTLNTKSLQPVCGVDDARYKLCMFNYYKYRAANLMFGFNTGIMRKVGGFNEFNTLRKNQLLAFYEMLKPVVGKRGRPLTNKYLDYYFMPQFEVGQQELVDLHYYTYELDLHSMQGKKGKDRELLDRVCAVNNFLVKKTLFSTNHVPNYEKIVSLKEFMTTKYFDFFLNHFMSLDYFYTFAALGFSEMNPKDKEINSLTRTVFYLSDMMRRQAHRLEFEFEKECINEMARSTLVKYLMVYGSDQNLAQSYKVELQIGNGYTYSKYNTLMHFLNVIECYWFNPDINSIQIFGKDIRTLLSVSCQKIFFEEGHTFYHYGPIELSSQYRQEMDLQLGNTLGEAAPSVSREKRQDQHNLIITDRVYEYHYLRDIVDSIFKKSQGAQLKSDDVILNLTLLSLLLDFGLYHEYAACLNLPFLTSLKHDNKRQLQVEISNLISEFDKSNKDSVSRLRVEELIFEASCKFMVNKNFSIRSREFELINQLNSDPVYHRYLLLCKIYMSLCQINKSVEVDYYKIRCNNDYQVVIPQNFSKSTSDYLSGITKRYNFSERDGFILYDNLHLFDIRCEQPEIDLYKVRFDSATSVESMVKYIEFSNVFVSSEQQYVIFIADNTLLVDVGKKSGYTIYINRIPVEIATVYFNEAVSFIPCFSYVDSEDVILFTSRNVHYLVDKAGQFNDNYYGMKHELIECINSDEVYVDLNDTHVFKKFKLSDLVTESKIVFFFPDYLLQVESRQQLINLLHLSIYLRNLSFFMLVLFYLIRSSVSLEFIEKDKEGVVKITGPWKEAIVYCLKDRKNRHYDEIFSRQFCDLNQHKKLPLTDFIDVLCDNFTRYQRFTDGQYQIIPTQKQKNFLRRIICAEECFHFSEVGSGKTKVILPLLCQTFLSNNNEAHKFFARGGPAKSTLVVLVPEHLVRDAQAQVFRYCLNLNFRQEYRIYDDIFALLHRDVQLSHGAQKGFRKYFDSDSEPPLKQIFVTSFHNFKKALTYDEICAKIQPYKDQVLVIVDEVDNFLDRDKLVFNICSNKNNDFKKSVLQNYFQISQAIYRGDPCPHFPSAANPEYWGQLYEKLKVIHNEIQSKSRSINKSFGIFNEQTLRHTSTNIAHDIEGYKSLIARPYESVNRAMPGSYYSDVERTIYLTYYILMEDISKYDELFQQERKFISFEYFREHIPHLDYDELVYGNNKLSALVTLHPETKDPLASYLYKIILRRMEIRDKSRSVNSIDVVFNFDCIGFTGTPFIDNYPTFAYIQQKRKDTIPDLIDRSFYVYSTTNISQSQFEDRFTAFQGESNHVMIEYIPSNFVQDAEELHILKRVFDREGDEFNVLVDLCGVFKKTSIYEVRDLVLQHFGPDRFQYIYHIDQTDESDRIFYLNSDNDVPFDEEFYKYLCKSYDSKLREKVFFFIDNRNVIGKDIPYQLIYQRHFGQPLFYKSVVLAHDVDDFSKIWQAMGRSRTMNATRFAIYKSNIPEEIQGEEEEDKMEEDGENSEKGLCDIKKHPLTRQLYVRNCDRKVAGNLSSIYQTLISLFNLSQKKFYYCNEIVNVFLEKMENTIEKKVGKHEETLVRYVFGKSMTSSILTHILEDKFQISALLASHTPLKSKNVEQILRQVVHQKYEQRAPTGDIFDEFIRFLSGEQVNLLEISYTKQHQKQKQHQHNKNQDSDTMEVFKKENQLLLSHKTSNYYQYTLTPESDLVKITFNLPISVPILKLTYLLGGECHVINVYPTVQFLYSNHIQPEYITKQVKETVLSYDEPVGFSENFLKNAKQTKLTDQKEGPKPKGGQELDIDILIRFIAQNPHYTIAAIEKGIYVIGMKDQFNIHDCRTHPLADQIQYIVDEVGFILHDKTDPAQHNLDTFGPYFIEQYILMETLSKQEVAQNVLEYYTQHKETLQKCLDRYNGTQGKGFICWRFVVN